MNQATITLPSKVVVRRAFTDKHQRQFRLLHGKDDYNVGDKGSVEYWIDIFKQVRSMIDRPIWLASELYALVESPDVGDHTISYRALANRMIMTETVYFARTGMMIEIPPWRMRTFQQRCFVENGEWQRRTCHFWRMSNLSQENWWSHLTWTPTQIRKVFEREPPAPELKDLDPNKM